MSDKKIVKAFPPSKLFLGNDAEGKCSVVQLNQISTHRKGSTLLQKYILISTLLLLQTCLLHFLFSLKDKFRGNQRPPACYNLSLFSSPSLPFTLTFNLFPVSACFPSHQPMSKLPLGVPHCSTWMVRGNKDWSEERCGQ